MEKILHRLGRGEEAVLRSLKSGVGDVFLATAARFENLVASHLLKSVKTWSALGEGELHLRFIRDKEKREVDFVIVEKRKPVCLVEAKAGEEELSPSLLYYQEKFDVPVAVHILHRPGVEKKMRKQGRIQWVVSADRWLTCLP